MALYSLAGSATRVECRRDTLMYRVTPLCNWLLHIATAALEPNVCWQLLAISSSSLQQFVYT